MTRGGARRIRPPRRRRFVLTTTWIIFVAVGPTGLLDSCRVSAALTNEEVEPQPHLPAPQEVDGECLVNPTSDEDAEDDSGGIVLPDLPPVDPDGYLDTGFGEKQQVIILGTTADEFLIRDRIEQMRQYLHREVLPTSSHDDDYNNRDNSNQRQAALAEECLLRHAHCAYWATTGECDNNPAYMTVQCAPVCSSCDQLLFDTRCPLQELPPDIWPRAGDLHKMFARIVTDPYYVQELGYQTQIILQPRRPGQDDVKDDAPWVVLVDDFLTDDECDTLIRLGQERGYERSMDVGQKKFDGTYDSHLSTGRTSANAWCMDACFEHPVTQTVLHKIENLTGIPDVNSEYLQLLQYQENQFYEVRESLVMCGVVVFCSFLL